MSNQFLALCICFLIYIRVCVNKICAYLEELDGTMQAVHMELFKIRKGE